MSHPRCRMNASYRQPSRNLCLCFFLQLATLSLLSTHFYLPNELLLHLSPNPVHSNLITKKLTQFQRIRASAPVQAIERADHKQYLYQDLSSSKTVSHSRRYLFCKPSNGCNSGAAFLLPLGRAPRHRLSKYSRCNASMFVKSMSEFLDVCCAFLLSSYECLWTLCVCVTRPFEASKIVHTRAHQLSHFRVLCQSFLRQYSHCSL